MSVKVAVPHVDDEGRKPDSPLRFRRVMIVGGSGYVGSALALGLRDDFEVFATYHKSPNLWIEGVHGFKLDCMSGNEVLQSVQRYRPDIVLYCGGLTSPLLCEQNPMIADALNNRALTLFFKVLPRQVPFAYFSCDQVFSSAGRDPTFRFTEQDDPDPQNEFSQSKVRGEGTVLGHNRLTYVMRVARCYGERLGAPQRPRETWVTQALELAAKNERISAPEDQWRSSVYIGDVVRAMRKFLRRAPLSSTLYHFSANDASTPFETTARLLEAWNLSADLLVKSTLEARIAAQNFTEPRFSALSAKRFEKEFDFRFQSFTQGLGELRERLETGYIQNWA